MSKSDLAQVEVRSLSELRDWLAENHGQAESIWLVTFKKAHVNYLPFGEVVEELMCWGWVDSSVRGLDEIRTMHLISPRKESSAWSAVNKKIVDEMRAAGRMQPAGEAKIASAQANGMWTFLDDVERLEVPEDLAKALGPHRRTWDGWTRSRRRDWLMRIKQAKTAPTREGRISACAAEARGA